MFTRFYNHMHLNVDYALVYFLLTRVITLALIVGVVGGFLANNLAVLFTSLALSIAYAALALRHDL